MCELTSEIYGNSDKIKTQIVFANFFFHVRIRNCTVTKDIDCKKKTDETYIVVIVIIETRRFAVFRKTDIRIFLDESRTFGEKNDKNYVKLRPIS